MDIDEAVACLEQSEEQELNRIRRGHQEAQAAAVSLQQEYATIAKCKRASEPSAAKKKKVTKTPVPTDIDAYDTPGFKAFIPPESVLWKSRSDGGWHIQVRNWPGSVNRSVQKYGACECIRIVLSIAWGQYCLLNGLEYGDVPIAGLLDWQDIEEFLTW